MNHEDLNSIKTTNDSKKAGKKISKKIVNPDKKTKIALSDLIEEKNEEEQKNVKKCKARTKDLDQVIPKRNKNFISLAESSNLILQTTSEVKTNSELISLDTFKKLEIQLKKLEKENAILRESNQKKSIESSTPKLNETELFSLKKDLQLLESKLEGSQNEIKSMKRQKMQLEETNQNNEKKITTLTEKASEYKKKAQKYHSETKENISNSRIFKDELENLEKEKKQRMSFKI